MRKFTSDFILSPEGELLQNHELVTTDSGQIISLDNGISDNCEKLNGILLPAFINTHCHLELSYLKGLIPMGYGLAAFIRDLITKRKNYDGNINGHIIIADQLIYDNGIDAVADICNTVDTIECKKVSAIYYHSLMEVYNPDPHTALQTINRSSILKKQFEAFNLHCSTVPHAPYSISAELFQLIKSKAENEGNLWSIHYQESADENKLFNNGSGNLHDLFIDLGYDPSWYNPRKETLLQYIDRYIPLHRNILLVHNTYMQKNELDIIKSSDYSKRIWLCICPKANLYIENKLPDINMLNESGLPITIGTDSLASNNTLSILDELKIIALNFPKIKLETLLTWATANGAAYMNLYSKGSFKEGNSPGLICISDIENKRLTQKSTVQRIF
jgi:aminodeoxyfutalosine deaminase